VRHLSRRTASKAESWRFRFQVGSKKLLCNFQQRPSSFSGYRERDKEKHGNAIFPDNGFVVVDRSSFPYLGGHGLVRDVGKIKFPAVRAAPRRPTRVRSSYPFRQQLREIHVVHGAS